jgi:adenosine/AMP kinase
LRRSPGIALKGSRRDRMELRITSLEIPKDCNIIMGHTHFIKSVEDLYEVMVSTSPHAKFGIAFSEASGPCLIRYEGNDKELSDAAVRNTENLGCGHVFIILLKNGYPINFLNAIKNCQEVCTIHCATANPVQVIVAESEQGKGILGVIDGFTHKGVEGESQQRERKELLRKFGYKLG